jgi:transcriptional regulator with XRE-family HTH domain
VHITQIQRYENGKSQPTLEIIKKMAVAMTVSADQLLFNEEADTNLKLKVQFEAIKGFNEEQQNVASEVIDALILKYQ